jgi:uncharacterized protein YecE (DUF72 family)
MVAMRVGTCGWSYPSGRGTWNGVFYPARRPRRFDELAYYAERFNSVEINSTFYRQPEPALAQSWLSRTPASFEFSVKLYQKFTHPDMFLARGGAADWTVTMGDLDQFRRGIDPLAEAGRLGVVLVQFPSSFHRDPDPCEYIAWLGRALGGYPIAVELRDRSWSDAAAETTGLLDELGAAWAYIDEPKFDTSIRQSLGSLVAAGRAPHVYIRFHGRNAARWWTHDEADDRYDYLYSAAELGPIVDIAKRASSAGRRVRVHFNNHFSAKAVVNAVQLRHQLGELVPGEYPREMVSRYPQIADIVRTDGLPI